MKCLFAMLAMLVVLPTAGAEAQTCEGLKDLALAHAHITSAHTVAPGSYVRPGHSPEAEYANLASFCLVQGFSTPVEKSHIGFEVWLPAAEKWTRRMMTVGNGAYESTLYYAQLAARIRAGDVGVATDTGHIGGADDLSFGANHVEAIRDWGGGRSVHEATVAAKAILKAYYGKPQRFAYFAGSSTGGHEALNAAQRYPEDFDGIIAGAPGNYRTHLNLEFLWEFQHNHPKGDNFHQIVPNDKLLFVNKRIVSACDALDGVKDGVISNPPDCHFNLDTLKCSAGDKPNCLTTEQIATLRAIYQGPRDARTGKQLYPGFPFGSEGVMMADTQKYPGWSAFWADKNDPTKPSRADFFRLWVFHDPNWNWWNFNWGSDVDTVDRVMGPVIDATNPDLSRFRAHGGKLIMFIGWSDPVGSANEATEYYESVVARGKGKNHAARLADTQTFARYYMVPGMGHTAGGPGASYMSTATRDSEPPVEDAQHDMTLALFDWVEKGKAPDALIGTHFSQGSGPSGKIAFQRPICVYPKIPRYVGGEQDKAASFACVGR
jgi:feruloyl esterase